MKVLHLINGWALGGITQAVLDLIQNTPNIEHYAAGYCWTSTSVKDDFEKAGCKSIIFPDETYEGFGSILAQNQIDIVHKQTGGGDFPEWVNICDRFDVKIVESLHCPRTSAIPKELIATTVVTTDYVAEKNKDRQIVKIPYPCTLPLGEPRELPKRRLKVGRMARYEVDKLPEIIAKVANLLWEFQDIMEFYIMGYPFNARVYDEMLRWEIPNYIHVLGKQDDKLEAIKQLDICIDPVWETSFDMVMTEAMSQGIPVVTWKNSAAPEVAGYGGIVTEEKVFCLAEAVKKLATDHVEYAKRSFAAINKIKTQHDPRKYGKAFEALYQVLLKK